MDISFASPTLYIAGLIVFALVIVVSIKFVRNRNVNIKADNGSSAINGKNSGNITINHRRDK
ncbi:Uncharacterised protein [Pseudomonas luteola]|uniref:Uncharacterized protein n=1 Tax=Pseudomonas luteola TaxID=47886 RepID=A0A2X2BWC8_PSELU|nr:hypothetical protein [Pseudomonas luteola]SPY99987.1 Uncharacterised protein [Pseudomonas luteola]